MALLTLGPLLSVDLQDLLLLLFESIYALTKDPRSPPPSLRHVTTILLSASEFDYFKFLIFAGACSICSPGSGFFHFA